MKKLSDEDLLKVALDAVQELYERGRGEHKKRPFSDKVVQIRHGLETVQDRVNKAVLILTGGKGWGDGK